MCDRRKRIWSEDVRESLCFPVCQKEINGNLKFLKKAVENLNIEGSRSFLLEKGIRSLSPTEFSNIFNSVGSFMKDKTKVKLCASCSLFLEVSQIEDILNDIKCGFCFQLREERKKFDFMEPGYEDSVVKWSTIARSSDCEHCECNPTELLGSIVEKVLNEQSPKISENSLMNSMLVSSKVDVTQVQRGRYF